MPSSGAVFSIIQEGKFKGQYTLAPLNGDIRTAFREWQLGEAWNELDRRIKNPEMYARMASIIISESARGDYEWGEDKAEKCLYTKKGFEQHIWLRLGASKGKIVIGDMDQFIKDAAILDAEKKIVVNGPQRLQFLLALADGWAPDPKVLPPLLEGTPISELDEFATLVTGKSNGLS